MYKKYLFGFSFFLCCILFIYNLIIEYTIRYECYEVKNQLKLVSGPPIKEIHLLEKQWVYSLSEEDYDALLRIVEAEAGVEDEEGKLLVANVVLNRVINPKFPETVKEVVFQNGHGVFQFSPVANDRFYNLEISKETIDAVERALCGEDISKGALYFVSRKYADIGKMQWFDKNLNYLFTHGGHEFFY